MENKKLIKIEQQEFHVISVMLITSCEHIPKAFFSNYAEMPGTVGYIVSCFEVQTVPLIVLKTFLFCLFYRLKKSGIQTQCLPKRCHILITQLCFLGLLPD